MPELRIPALFPHQEEAADAPHRYKASQWGRRAGKSRMAYHVGILGHGPVDTEGEPRWKGIRHGYDVLWVGRSLDQARVIWNEEVRPRFNAAGGHVNDTLLTASLPGCGRLFVRSQDRESINNARGMGARLIGVIGDEVAHWADAEEVWLEVLVPMLADNFGWAWFISTTYPGSWFNQLCEEIETGDPRRANWFFSHKTALDNPRITREAFAAMVAEYPPDDPRLAQEVWAKRTAGGGGLAFPEWAREVHVLPAKTTVPPYWRWAASMDWGYTSPGCFHLWALGDKGEVWGWWEYTFREQAPFDVGHAIALTVTEHALPEYVVGDSSMWAVTDGGPTIAEEVQRGFNAALGNTRLPLVSTPKGPGSRVSGKMHVHEALKWDAGPDGRALPWAMPKLRVHARCVDLVRTIPRLLRDERRPEDVDTEGPDHWYDSLRYLLMSRAPVAEVPRKDIPQDVHPGFRADGKRRARHRTLEAEVEEEMIATALSGEPVGGRYGVRQGW